MSHVRTQLRNATIAALKAGVPAFGSRVEKVRGYRRTAGMLPSAEVSTPAEEVVGDSMDGLLMREVELMIAIRVTGSDEVEDACDALAAAVETALFDDTDVMALVVDLTPASMDFEMEGDAETRVARMDLRWAAVVRTMQDDPETAL